MTDKRTFGGEGGIRLAWTAARTERAVELWREGYSASYIADLLGGTTREAVCGKIWRESRTRPDLKRVEQNAVSYQHIERKSRAARDGHRGTRKARERSPEFSATPLPPEPPMPPRMVSLADLEANQCRFPFGNPRTAEFGFCGCPALPGQSYCNQHLQLCYTDYTPRRAIQNAEVNHKIARALRVVEEGVE